MCAASEKNEETDTLMERDVVQTVTGNRAIDGAGVRLVRVLGRETTRAFDPFLMLDAFDSHNPEDYIKGFPWHPHRGIETVTYLIEGAIEHQDSLGNVGMIEPGGCQWMTAGSGILHQEMPQASPRMLGLQLWLNLPAEGKMTAPKYRDIKADEIPVKKGEGSEVRVVASANKAVPGGASGDFVPLTLLDVKLDPGASFTWETAEDDTLFAYIFDGDGHFGKGRQAIPAKHAVLTGAGDSFSFTAGDKGLRLVLCQSEALKEPIAWGGPIVMNTREELQRAFDELEDGTFIKK